MVGLRWVWLLQGAGLIDRLQEHVTQVGSPNMEETIWASEVSCHCPWLPTAWLISGFTSILVMHHTWAV